MIIMIDKKIADRVLVIAPDYMAKGGISSVVKLHHSIYSSFNFLPTSCTDSVWKKLFILLKSLIVFPIIIKSKKISIIHIHTSSYISFYRKSIFILLGSLFGCKIICHIHAGNFLHFYSDGYKKYILLILKKCDIVLVLSNKICEEFKNNIPLENIRVINNMVLRPLVFERKKQSNMISLLFLGHIYKEKGIFDLVEYLKNNYDKYVNRLILYIGGGLFDVEKLIQYIKLNNLELLVNYLGWVDGENKNELISSADIFILPSYNEALPMCILEAMSYSKPIIATKVGAIPEIVEDGKNGFLFNLKNLDQMGECIDKFLDDPDLICKMGSESYKIVQKYFPENVESDIVKLYKELL